MNRIDAGKASDPERTDRFPFQASDRGSIDVSQHESGEDEEKGEDGNGVDEKSLNGILIGTQTGTVHRKDREGTEESQRGQGMQWGHGLNFVKPTRASRSGEFFPIGSPER